MLARKHPNPPESYKRNIRKYVLERFDKDYNLINKGRPSYRLLRNINDYDEQYRDDVVWGEYDVKNVLRFLTKNRNRVEKVLTSQKQRRLAKRNQKTLLQELKQHIRSRPELRTEVSTSSRSAIRNYINDLVIRTNENLPVQDILKAAKQHMKVHLERLIGEALVTSRRQDGIRFAIIANVRYTTDSGNEMVLAHRTKTRNITSIAEIVNVLNQSIADMHQRVEDRVNGPSSLRYLATESIILQSGLYKQHRGSSYMPLPAWIKNKKACINIKNNDELCAKWCIAAFLHPATRDKERTSKYKDFLNECKWDNIQFPMKVSSWDKFEEMNPLIAVNVHLAVDHELMPIRASKRYEGRNEVNLLLIDSPDNSHYMLIQSLTRLLNSKNSNGTIIYNAKYCPRCHSGFADEINLNEHRKTDCDRNKECKIVLPKKEKAFIQYNANGTDIYKQVKLPYIIVGDTEALVKMVQGADSANTKTKLLNQYEQMSFCFVIINEMREVVKMYEYCGPNAHLEYVKKLKEAEQWVLAQYERKEHMNMSHADWRNHQNANVCYLCKKEFAEGDWNDKTDKNRPLFKVRDHCHITGRYRGALHNKCNFHYHNRWSKIPVYHHNGSGYDLHFIIPYLRKSFKEVSVVSKSMEKFMCINADKLQFVDSMSHITGSLDSIVSSLKEKGDHSKHFRILFKNLGVTEEQAPDFLRKGVYPYEYMNSFDKLNETSLPPIESFKSSLNNSVCSKEDYEYAQYIFKKYCKTMRDYHNLYLRTDVLLLADVIEEYRELNIKTYELDPAHFITLSSLSWMNLLKSTKEKIELFHEKQEEMLLMIERGIRGGFSGIMKRYAIANGNRIIKYFDANNLYGWSMSQPLPIGDYKWEDERTYTIESIMMLDDFGERGYTLDVDIYIPEHIHDYLKDFAPAPEKCIIQDDMLSAVARMLKQKHNILSDTSPKLIMSLRNRKNYVVHYRLLKKYIELGIEITKINRVLSYKQKRWIEPYVKYNADCRAKSTSKFEQNQYKNKSNVVYGKSMENVRKRTNIKIYTSNNAPSKTKMRTYETHTTIGDDMVAIEFTKNKCNMDKPVIIGQTVLDLSKLHMYNSFYFLKNRYPDMQLLMTDTDSFILDLPKKFNDDLANDEELKSMFDCSKYKKDSPLYDNRNAGVMGKFKDELPNDEILEFVGLRAKMYSIRTTSTKMDKQHTHAKGISKSCIKNLEFNTFKRILFDQKQEECRFNTIRSKKHKVFIMDNIKTGLSSYDNKFYLTDNINSLPYGHYRCRG
jgi:hypothetical protein